MARPRNESKKRQMSMYVTESDIIRYKRASIELGINVSELIETSLREFLDRNADIIKKAEEENSRGITGMNGEVKNA
jgi:uncharacterized NAD-dependent epimerase/dehydratase family protein